MIERSSLRLHAAVRDFRSSEQGHVTEIRKRADVQQRTIRQSLAVAHPHALLRGEIRR